jgi:hypothetical protein
MTLAGILGLCALLSPPWAVDAIDIRFLASVQASQSQGDLPQAGSSQEPSKPAEQETNPDKSASPAQTPAPAPTQQPKNPQPDSAGRKQAGKTTSATRAKRTRHHRKHKNTRSLGSGPTKTVVRNGSTADPEIQISPGLSEEQASHERQNTTQLLASTEANLKKVSGGRLSPSQQDVVSQIRKYMEQAKAADDEKDLQRAHNLAFKAHLLSDELVKH